jgi:hypothetical protein
LQERVGGGGFHLSHLFFVDSILLFCKAKWKEWSKIQGLLEVYKNTSGQKINKKKTSIFFSKSTRREFSEYILSL